MKIHMMLAIKPSHAAQARKQWQELGGSPAAILPGSDEIQLTFVVPDEASPDGRLLDQLARELNATADGAALLALSANYDAHDIASAELLLLEIGGVEGAVDRATVESDRDCPHCGRPQPSRLSATPRLLGKTITRLDIFTAEAISFVRDNLADALGHFLGAVLTQAESSASAGTFFALEPATSLGYPTETRWSEPCPVCGVRKGSHEGPYIVGKFTFPRKAWDGSDILGSSLSSNFLIVTQPVWKVLTSRKWRAGEGVLASRPIHLDPDAPPVR
jgi:hypothetical protein